MNRNKAYKQHEGKVVENDATFKHVMAIALDAMRQYKDGVIRCIVSRTGDPAKAGNVDRSELYRVAAADLEHIRLTEPLVLKHQKEITDSLSGNGDFIGLEDPDLFFDERTGLLHLYFTMPFIHAMKQGAKKQRMAIHLGHAVGKDIDTLEMTVPAITAHADDEAHICAKELSVAPVNSQGIRLNLIESSDRREGVNYSTVRVAIAEDMGKPWKFGPTIFHPGDHKIPWVAGHASPGPLFPKSFIDVGKNKMLGILNGREENKGKGPDKVYGHFTAGLYIYDYELGKIDWVSPETLIRDTEANNITFASQFIQTSPGEGILYAHVDDSFVRAYTLYADGLKALLPK